MRVSSKNEPIVTYLYSEKHEYLYINGCYSPWGEYQEYLLKRVSDDVVVKVLAKDLKIISGAIGEKIIAELNQKKKSLVEKKSREKAQEYANSLSIDNVRTIDGVLVLYDKSVSFKNLSYYILWDSVKKKYIKVDKSIAKDVIGKVTDLSAKHDTIDRYIKWLTKFFEDDDPGSFVRRELLTSQEMEEVILADRHKEFMSKNGLVQNGEYVRVSSQRETYCWRCKGALSSTSNLGCPICRGLICSCGACLCGRNNHV